MSDPIPRLISRAEMVAKFTAAGIHRDSPCGRSLLLGGDHGIFEDASGAWFTVDPERDSESAQAFTGRPLYARVATDAPDFGDLVVDRMLGTEPADRHIAQALAQPDPLNFEALGPRNPATGLRPGQNLQDGILERLKSGEA